MPARHLGVMPARHLGTLAQDLVDAAQHLLNQIALELALDEPLLFVAADDVVAVDAKEALDLDPARIDERLGARLAGLAGAELQAAGQLPLRCPGLPGHRQAAAPALLIEHRDQELRIAGLLRNLDPVLGKGAAQVPGQLAAPGLQAIRAADEHRLHAGFQPQAPQVKAAAAHQSREQHGQQSRRPAAHQPTTRFTSLPGT